MPPSICIEYMLRTLVPPNDVAMPKRPSPAPRRAAAGQQLRQADEAAVEHRQLRQLLLVDHRREVGLGGLDLDGGRPADDLHALLHAPTDRAIRRSATWPTVSTTFGVGVRIPPDVDSTVYGPGCSAGTRNPPCSSVTTTRSTPVAVLTIVTATPGSAPPEDPGPSRGARRSAPAPTPAATGVPPGSPRTAGPRRGWCGWSRNLRSLQFAWRITRLLP